MFKLPDLPSPQADCTELADFAELLAWDKGAASAREIVAYLGQLDDPEVRTGCDDNDDENAEFVDEVMNELERRKNACGNGYPFVFDLKGTVLRHVMDKGYHSRSEVYLFLLLATRLNMRDNRVHANLDGAHLFEALAADVLRCYLHPFRARSIVFGTSVPGQFEDKINNLCKSLGEGGAFRNLGGGTVDANDDKLDTVAWVPFSDSNCGQLIIFAQCKTGSTWGGQTTQLQPEGFIKRWMEQSYASNPVRAFCIAEAADRCRWFGYSVYTGLLLDRCRLVDFCEDVDPALVKSIQTWNTAAKLTVEFVK